MSLIVSNINMPIQDINTALYHTLNGEYLLMDGESPKKFQLFADGHIDGLGEEYQFWTPRWDGTLVFHGRRRSNRPGVDRTAVFTYADGEYTYKADEKTLTIFHLTSPEEAFIPVKMFGLQRTCTNLTLKLLKSNLNVLDTEHGSEWKHGRVATYPMIFPRTKNGQPVRLVICTKNPFAWLFSMYRMDKRGHVSGNPDDEGFSKWLRSKHTGFPDPVIRWNEMHRHWLEITEKHPNLTFVVKSEDLQSIEGQIQMITDFAAKFDITAPTHLNTFNKYIGQLGGAAGNAHNREWYNSEGYMLTYSKDNFKYVMELIDPDIAVKLGYEL